MVYVFKNWKLLFENICENTCEWKSALKCVKCCLKTENDCLKSQTKHPLNGPVAMFRAEIGKLLNGPIAMFRTLSALT